MYKKTPDKKIYNLFLTSGVFSEFCSDEKPQRKNRTIEQKLETINSGR